MTDDTSTDVPAARITAARITAEDIAPIPRAHLLGRRRDARQRLGSADDHLSAADQARDRAIAAHDQAETAARGTAAMVQARAASLADADTRLDTARARHDTAAALVEVAERAADAAALEADRRRELATGVEQLVAAGPPADESGVATTRRRLAELVELSAQCSEPIDVAALGAWSDQLDAGTAPILDDAAELLEELADLDAEWQSCGAGDLARDPDVVAATARCSECQQAFEAMDDGGTGAGHEARNAIEAAHRRRTEIEARGRRADPAELDAAVRAEVAALGYVGFDSMLDFRIAMSGAGTGALAARRRQVVADELAAAVADLERIRDDRARHHTALRERRAATRRRGVDRFDLDDSIPIEDQLRRLLVLPSPVRLLADATAASAAAATEASGRAAATLEDAATELAAARTTTEDGAAEVERRTRALAAAERDAGIAAEELVAAAAVLRDAEVARTDVERQREDAATAVAALEAVTYLPEDIDELAESLAALVLERLEDGDGPVEMWDPLADEPVEATLRLLDAMEATGAPVELVTTRRALLAATQHRTGEVVVVDGRRHRLRLGQRRRREPSTRTR